MDKDMKNRVSKKRKPSSRCLPPAGGNAGYFIFLRAYRKRHSHLSKSAAMKEVSKIWCTMPEWKRNVYRRRAACRICSPKDDINIASFKSDF